MKKLALSLLLCGASAFATTLTYSTSATFGGPDAVGGGASLANGGATLTYTPVPTTSVDTPTNISLGSIQALGNGTFVGDSIDLTITQTTPTPGGNVMSSSTIDGTITSTSNGIDLVFTPSVLSVASDPAITYILQDSYLLVAPNTNNGVTTIQASVTAAPEPASLGLIGGSLLGFAMISRRLMVKK